MSLRFYTSEIFSIVIENSHTITVEVIENTTEKSYYCSNREVIENPTTKTSNKLPKTHFSKK